MSGERADFPTGGNGLLRGSRAKSYGSLVRSSFSPVTLPQTLIEHQVQPGETLQGLALKYGVSMERIQRANRLYPSDSIFLKQSLSIPVLSDSDAYNNGGAEEDSGDGTGCVSAQNRNAASSAEKMQGTGREGAPELSPMDFLKRMDSSISRSKQAAVQACQEGEKRFSALEAACSSGTPDRRLLTRSQSAISSPRMHQLAVPHTITKHTKKLRDREDEIFEL